MQLFMLVTDLFHFEGQFYSLVLFTVPSSKKIKLNTFHFYFLFLFLTDIEFMFVLCFLNILHKRY